MKKRGGLFDGFIVALIIFFGAFLTFHYNLKPLASIAFFFVLPSVYMLLRGRFNYKKIFFMAILTGIIAGFADVIFSATKAWVVPDEQLFIAWRIFNSVPFEDFIWFFSFALFAITFYEFFIEKDRIRGISKNSKWFFILALGTIFIVTLLVFLGWFEKIKYSYLVICSIYMTPPVVYLLFRNTNFIKKFFYISIPLFLINLLHELVALKVGQWVFPGEYIGTFVFFGFSFPFEEFFFYLFLGSITAVAYYEIFLMI